MYIWYIEGIDQNTYRSVSSLLNQYKMARVENGNISGAIGNIVFYTMNGKTYAKAKPTFRKRKKNEPLSPQVQQLSTVSFYGTPVLNWLKPQLAFKFKRNTFNDFRKWLGFAMKQHENDSSWPIATANTLVHNINRESEIRDILLLLPTVTVDAKGNSSIKFPSFIPVNQIKAPTGTAEVQLKLITVSAPFSKSVRTCFVQSDSYNFSYNKTRLDEKEIILPTKAKTGYMVFVMIAMVFTKLKAGEAIIVNDEQWLPAAVVAAGKL